MPKDNTFGADTGTDLPGTQAFAPPGGGVARVKDLLEGAALRGTTRTVYAALLFHCDAHGRYRGYVGDFPARTGVGYESVRKSLRRLRDLGLIVAERRGTAHRPGVWRVVAVDPAGEGPTT